MKAVCVPTVAPRTVKYMRHRQQRTHEDTRRVNCSSKPPWADCQLAILSTELDDGFQDTRWLQSKLAEACKDGRLDEALGALLHMEQRGIVPSMQAYCHLLQICRAKRALAEAQRIHAHVARTGLESNLFVGESLVSTLVKCGSLEDALHAFHRLPHPTVFSWTAVMTGYVQEGEAEEALRWYRQMQAAGVQPNKHTFVALLRACAGLADLGEGKRVHADAVKHGCEHDLFVGTALLDMYARCGSMVAAQEVFDRLSRPDVASWTAIIAGYVRWEQGEKAFELYQTMQQDGVRPNDRTLGRLLQACCSLADSREHVIQEDGSSGIKAPDILQKGKAIHAEAARMGSESDMYVGSILVHMYVSLGSLLDAQHVFERLSHHDVVTWTAMIAGYSQFEEGEKALQLYVRMQEAGVRPTGRTFVSALGACGSLVESWTGDGPATELRDEALQKGKAIHAQVARMGDEADVFIGSALVHMYAKCGSLPDAQQAFDALPERDVVAWTAMIAACAEQGEGRKALDMYTQMQAAGVAPNETTFLCILRACSDVGALHMCHEICGRVRAQQERGSRCSSSSKWAVVGNALIHAYGKCGSMVHSEQVFKSLPRPDLYAWTALIAGYARQGDSEAGLQCYHKMLQAGVKPNGVTFLSLLWACSHSGLVDRGVGYLESMTREHGIPATIQHYGIVMDMLCRAGLLSRAEELLLEMPLRPDLAIWSSLLAACRQRGNSLELGRRAFDASVRLAPKDGAAYVVMSNIYADAGMWDLASQIDGFRQNAGAWKQPGQSWIQDEDRFFHVFMSGDHKQQQIQQIHTSLKQQLVSNMEF